ncbi:iron uptake porin [filamentous cyanobacterium LEGE 11480]|uniref:Iron uptake porin n=1 Tax=Romeriopsis navalis LEGE 11480 TaxID=2777977 RepID=A0A928Z6Y6_9CYAN|nr:iron uptake porin [Romeriopsis navalis]MBE9033138.1 iron uptake porin [Romeriopsis navalis LEGE 11480]
MGFDFVWQVRVRPERLCTIIVIISLSHLGVLSAVPAIAADVNPAMVKVNTVDDLSDVKPNDWAYQALANLIERYGILRSTQTKTYWGDRPLTRSEFAATLAQVLEKLQSDQLSMTKADHATIQQLQQNFAPAVASLTASVSELESRTQQIASQQFTPTVKFRGQAIIAATAGAYGGDRIIAPRGAVVTEDPPGAIVLNRVALFFDTSFSGTDQLQIRLISGSAGPDDNFAGALEPNFGSTLDYAVQGRDNNVSLARAFYAFKPIDDLRVTVGPLLSIADYVDNSRVQPPSFRGFSTQAFNNNFVLLPRPFGGGAVLDWQPKSSDFSIRAAYVSGDAADSIGENARLFGGGGVNDIRLFPIAGGSDESGLFGDPRQYFAEVEYAPTKAFALRLQYAGGQVFGSDFNGVGINAEWAVSNKFALFGRYGYSRYNNATIGNVTPQYWFAGATYSGLFKTNDLAGIAVAQPFVENIVGDRTQTNFELFYAYPVQPRLTITPFFQIVSHPANQERNATIFSGGLRSVFSF